MTSLDVNDVDSLKTLRAAVDVGDDHHAERRPVGLLQPHRHGDINRRQHRQYLVLRYCQMRLCRIIFRQHSLGRVRRALARKESGMRFQTF